LHRDYPSDAAQGESRRFATAGRVDQLPIQTALERNEGGHRLRCMDNPFTYGNPISDPLCFIGRRREIDQVLSRLANRAFESSSIVAERRVGKTSMLNQLMSTEVRARRGLDDDRYVCVYIDLQMIDETVTPTRLWKRVLMSIERQLPMGHQVELAPLLSHESIDTFVLDDAFEAIDACNVSVVLLLDEFEHVTMSPRFSPDFFYGLRSLATRHSLALVTSSRLQLIELSHSDAIRSSPFFNIFANVRLPLLADREAQELISSALHGTSVQFTPDELGIIDELAGPHPFFIQMAGAWLFEEYARTLDAAPRSAALRQAFQAEAEPHFEQYWRSSEDQEKICLTALALLEHGQNHSERRFRAERLVDLTRGSVETLERLYRRGLLVEGDGGYAIFSSALGAWVLTELRATLADQQSYEAWAATNRPTMKRVARRTRASLDEILPRIAAGYRDLIVDWATDPRSWGAVAGLFKPVLGLG
jgi:hypothetical protein